MALIHTNFFSEVIGVCSSMYIILPDPKRGSDGKLLGLSEKNFPVLYLLHGLSDDYTIWQRRTSIERYVAKMDLAVVMPAVQRSFYADMNKGYKYWTFISEELPSLVEAWFPVSSAREDRFVAGLSMGGYGAFKLALRKPECFGAAASLSGVLDLRDHLKHSNKVSRAEFQRIFGNPKDFPGSPNDLFALAENLSKSDYSQLPLYQWCGTEDALYQDNLRFSEFADQLGLNLTYEEGEGGHEWGAWDLMIQRVLNWLPLHKKKREDYIATIPENRDEVKSVKKKKKGGKKKK